MWNVIWVTAEADSVNAVIERFKELKIMTRKRTMWDDDRCFFEILVPAAETGIALDALADM